MLTREGFKAEKSRSRHPCQCGKIHPFSFKLLALFLATMEKNVFTLSHFTYSMLKKSVKHHPPSTPNFHIFFSLNPSLPFLILPMTRRDSSPARPPVTDQNITGLNQPAQSRQSEHISQLFRIPIITTILPFISEVEEVVAVVVIVRIASDLV